MGAGSACVRWVPCECGRRSVVHDHAVQTAVEVDKVDLAGLVLAEGRDLERSLQHLLGGDRALVDLQREETPRADITEDVDAHQVRLERAAVDIAAGDRAAEGVVVLGDRLDEPRLVAAGRDAVTALHDVPAVVLPAERVAGLAVDLLPGALADVTDVEIAIGSVEAEAPGVPQPVGPDLGEPLARGDPPVRERVVRRDGVRFAFRRIGIHVQAEDLAQQRLPILTVAVRIAAGSAIAKAKVEVAVRTEGQLSAVVVAVGLLNDQQHSLAVRIGGLALGGRGQLRQDGRAIGEAALVDEQASVGLEVRVEGEPQQTLFPATPDATGQVNEGLRSQRAVGLDHTDHASLLVDEQSPAAVARVGNVDRVVETLHDALEAQVIRAGRKRRVGGAGDRGAWLVRGGSAAAGARFDRRGGGAPDQDGTEDHYQGRPPGSGAERWDLAKEDPRAGG